MRSLDEILADLKEHAACLPDPSVVPCRECGRESVPVGLGEERCRRCVEIARAIERRIGSIPGAFRWAMFGVPALEQRTTDRARAQGQAAVECGRVVLIGPAGCGKTSLAAAMMRQYLQNAPNYSAHFSRAWRLGLARARHSLGDGEPPEVQAALRADLSVLDDLGSERQNATNAVPDVIFERHAEGKPLWVTTAMSQDEMSSRYGDGIARRVWEGARIIDCGNSDREERAGYGT